MMTADVQWEKCSVDPSDPCVFEPAGDYRDDSGKVGRVQLLRCASCGVGVSYPPLENVAFLYDDRTSQDFQPKTNALAALIKSVAFRRQAKALLRQIPDPKPARVLDFGCGSGLFTRCLGDLLASSEVVGSDFHDVPPPSLVDRPYRSMAALDALKGSFDLVMAMHVLEHDDDVSGLLRSIVSMARPGGMVIIEVPNIDCVWAGIFGRAWDAWYFPFHRTHFSRKALRGLMQSEGLTILGEMDVTVPTMGRSLSNLVGGNKGFFFLLAGIALHPLQWALERVTCRPSSLRIIARR